MARRNRILDKIAAAGVTMLNVTPSELQKIAQHKSHQEPGQMSYEASEIRTAKDKVQRAAKVKTGNYSSLADRFDKDPAFATRQAEIGLTRHDMLRLELVARGFLPHAGRTRQQVILGNPKP